jgi:hypothetical protein
MAGVGGAGGQGHVRHAVAQWSVYRYDISFDSTQSSANIDGPKARFRVIQARRRTYFQASAPCQGLEFLSGSIVPSTAHPASGSGRKIFGDQP